MPTTHIPDTGNGATFAMAGTGFTGHWTELGSHDQSIEKLDDSHLGTVTFKSYIPGDLKEADDIEVQYLFYGTSRMPDGVTTLVLPQLGTTDVVTITFPDPVGGTPATLAGSGFVSKIGTPDLKNNELMMGTLTWTWDGSTGPSFTGRT